MSRPDQSPESKDFCEKECFEKAQRRLDHLVRDLVPTHGVSGTGAGVGTGTWVPRVGLLHFRQPLPPSSSTLLPQLG